MNFCLVRLWTDEKYFLITLYIVALSARLIFFYLFLYDNPMMLAYDSAHYHGVAQTLLHGFGFFNADGSAHLYRVPGYPLFWALCLLFGGNNSLVALTTQICFASVIPVLVYFLARRLFPSNTLLAKITALVVAVHIGFMIFAGLVMAESLFIGLFLLALIFFFKAADLVLEKRVGGIVYVYFVLSGLLAGCAALTRPVGLYLLVWFVLALFVLIGWNRKTLTALLCVCCAWGCVVGSWVVRNWLHTGCAIVHTFPGHHMINHGAARVLMMAEHVPYQCALDRVKEIVEKRWAIERHEYAPCRYEVARSMLMQNVAHQVLFSYPFQTAQLCISNDIKTMLSLYSSELLFIDSGGVLPAYEQKRSFVGMFQRYLFPVVINKKIRFVIYAEMLFHLFLLLSLLSFLYVMARRRRRDYATKRMVLIIGLCVLFIVPTGLCGFARLRLPIEPFFIMLAIAFWRKKQKGESKLW